MPVRAACIAVVAAAAFSMPAMAQSLSPMHKSGVTPGEVKGFRLTVGNPYKQRMQFVLMPMEPGFDRPAAGASVTPSEMVLAPGYSRQAIVAFKIPPRTMERTIGLCVLPKNIDGPVLPRICGTYTGARLTGRGR